MIRNRNWVRWEVKCEQKDRSDEDLRWRVRIHPYIIRKSSATWDVGKIERVIGKERKMRQADGISKLIRTLCVFVTDGRHRVSKAGFRRLVCEYEIAASVWLTSITPWPRRWASWTRACSWGWRPSWSRRPAASAASGPGRPAAASPSRP